MNFSEEQIIGKGGFGTFYRAAHPEGRRVPDLRVHRECEPLRYVRGTEQMQLKHFDGQTVSRSSLVQPVGLLSSMKDLSTISSTGP